VNVARYGKAEFRQQQRYRTHRREELRNLTYQNLQRFLENRWLDRATFDRLSEMLEAFNSIQRAKADQEMFNTRRRSLYEQQEQLRANLTALNPTGQESSLRNRMLSQLEAAQDQLEALDKRRDELEQEMTAAAKHVEQIIAELG
jgi:hypothetical protein